MELLDDEEIFSGIDLYPNPAQTSFSIKLSEQIRPATVEVYDINGRLIKTITTDKPSVLMDVTNWARGVYMVKISTSEKTITKKISLLP